jgi:NIPSNAP protein
MPRTVQLRTYTVKAGKLDEWVQQWRELVVPLRREFGFEIHGAWVDRERSQHTWVVSYEGPETFEERNAAYWASAQRKAMGLDPSQYLVGEEMRPVEEAL